MEVFVDGSHSFCTARSTGIERVVRKLADELTGGVAVSRGVSARRVIFHREKVLLIDRSLQQQLDQLIRFEGNPGLCLPAFLNKSIDFVATNFLSERSEQKVRKLFLPKAAHLGAYKVPFLGYKNFVLNSAVRREACVENLPAGSLLVLPDAYWTKRWIWKSIHRLRQNGVKVASVFYDLIPLTHPQFVGGKRTEKFASYMRSIMEHSDLIVTISGAVREELVAYVLEKMPEYANKVEAVRSFRLGADLPESNGEVRTHVEKYFKSNQNENAGLPYVVVGSLDPRKNHVQVLLAFEQLLAEGKGRRLCFVGRSGGLSAPLLDRMKSSPLADKYLTHFDDLNDFELEFAYKNCHAVIMPSVVEGFGLPIVEALWHGASVLASDIPIHREVGGSHCQYFPLHDSSGLSAAIERVDSQPKRSVRIAPVTWNQSAGEFLDVCLGESVTNHRAA